MKFIVDDMLGKLAKYLRLMGYDTLYPKHSEDKYLRQIAQKEKRILITRDTELSRIKKLNSILIKSTDTKEQLKELKKQLKIKPNKKLMFTRCSECNSKTQKKNKESVKKLVPAMVYDLFDDFRYCPKCKKAYWPGSHYTRILKDLLE